MYYMTDKFDAMHSLRTAHELLKTDLILTLPLFSGGKWDTRQESYIIYRYERMEGDAGDLSDDDEDDEDEDPENAEMDKYLLVHVVFRRHTNDTTSNADLVGTVHVIEMTILTMVQHYRYSTDNGIDTVEDHDIAQGQIDPQFLADFKTIAKDIFDV